MGLPAQKRTNTSKRQRASHFALKKQQTITCEHCGAKTRPHQVCAKCGYYKGKQVLKRGKETKRASKKAS